MPLPILGILTQLAGFAPLLMKYVGAGDSATKIAEQVAGVAQVVSGASTPQEAVAALAGNADKMREFQLKVMDNERAWDEMILKDVQSARDRDVKLAQAGYRNSRANSMYFLAVAVIFLLVYLIWQDQHINEYVKGIFTLVLGRFLGYLDSIYNFEFGTTRSSKTKDETIQKLTHNGSSS